MITLIIGHRGVGKTTFLSRLKTYFEKVGAKCECFDLDEEVEKAQGQSIAEIFKYKGEAFFRDLETSQLQTIVDNITDKKTSYFVAVGAGYSGPFPEDVQILWLRRETDKDGRIFFDRPLLDESKSPLDDYLSRFEKREYFYSKVCDEQLMLLEGYDREAPWEELFLGTSKTKMGGILTLFDTDLRRFAGGETFLARRLNWGISRFEVRDDLLEEVLIRYLLGLVPRDRLLLSFRSPRKSIMHSVIDEGAYFDWPMEKGKCPFPVPPSIFSLHQRLGNLQDTITQFESAAPKQSHLKLAVEIETLQELYEGHQWWKEDPRKRSFLPVSSSGKWRWYRTLFSPQMQVGFFREGVGSCLDQPYFAEWVRTPKVFSHFGAVIGDPVHHSQSPAEHQKFFENHHLPFVAIPIEDRGDFLFHFEILKNMGLVAAAVTSPYKNRVFEACSEVQKQASAVGAVNTMLLKNDQWIGGNTDIDGLQTVKDLYPELAKSTSTVLWGGGGTQEVMKGLFPQAQRYSARQAKPVQGDQPVESPEVVVWAVGRSRQNECLWPPEKWKPAWVVDLNYTLDSPGREWALKTGAEYVSGLTMFQSQARTQQRFWIEHKL